MPGQLSAKVGQDTKPQTDPEAASVCKWVNVVRVLSVIMNNRKLLHKGQSIYHN